MGRFLPFLALILWGTQALGQAAPPKDEARFVRVDSLPVPGADKFVSRVLHRGDAVTVIGSRSNVAPDSDFVPIDFKARGKLAMGAVPRWTLSLAKPAARKSAPNQPAAGGAASLERMKGTWGLVGYTVFGAPNPVKETPILDMRHPIDASKLDFMRGAVNVSKLDIPGNAQLRILPWEFGPTPNADCFHFSGNRLTVWSAQNDDHRRDSATEQADVESYELRIDPKQNPRRMDVVLRVDGEVISTTPGIYEFDGEFLKWSQAPELLIRGVPGQTQEQVERRRPKGFGPDDNKKAVVAWLARVDERDFPTPEPPAASVRAGEWIETPLETLYVAPQTLPVAVGDELPGCYLHRGDAVRANDCRFDRQNASILFKANGKWVSGRAMRWLLRDEKPALPAALGKAKRAEPEGVKSETSLAERLKGTWVVAAYAVHGLWNPGVEDIGEVTVNVPRGDADLGAHQMDAFWACRLAQCYTFSTDHLVTWNPLPTVHDGGKIVLDANRIADFAVRVDDEAKPKRLDLRNGNGSTQPGIVEFDGDLLKWAQAPQPIPVVIESAGDLESRRPKVFDAKTGNAVIIWLARLPARQPKPPEPKSN